MDAIFFQPDIRNGVLLLSTEGSRHCVKVLRKKEGDVITVTDGKGSFFQAIITKADSGKCGFTITSEAHQPADSYHIHLAIAPTKHPDRMEWMVEKCTEMGIHEITFINCEHSERRIFKLDRINKIAIAAMKQSQRAWLPVINPIKPLVDFISIIPDTTDKFIAHAPLEPLHLMKTAKKNRQYIVLIGPEGDFTGDEISACLAGGFSPVLLGPNRLRTETAGLFACATLNLINQLE